MSSGPFLSTFSVSRLRENLSALTTSSAGKAAAFALLSGVLCVAGAAQGAIVFPGTTSVGQTSQTGVSVTVKLAAGGSPTSVAAITQSAATSEFTVSDQGSCASGTYGAGQSCSVTVTFKPKYPGLRKGAVVVSSGSTVLGTALVSGIGSGSLSVIQPGVINTVVGSGDWVFVSDGVPADGAPIFLPTGIVEDAAGNLFLSDSNNQRVRRVDATTGLISTVAGDGSPGYNGDGIAATNAAINQPAGLVLDGAGNIFFVDHGNHCVRRVDAFSGLISTVAGVCGSPNYTGDGGLATAAKLRLPEGLAIDAVGNLYIADTGNNAIREVTIADGNINTIAGTGVAGYNGEGTAAAKQLSSPWGVVVGPGGALYIADRNNERVRMVQGGVISTVAGIGSPGFSGDGSSATSATLDAPVAVTVDPAGNLYVADSGNNRIREVSGGTIQTIVGTSSEEFAGDTGPANMATIYGPYALYFDQTGNLFLADMFHNRVREVSGTTVSLTYPTMRVGKLSAPQAEVLVNDGNATMNVASLVMVNAALDPATSTCSATVVLPTTSPSCTMGVEFAPQQVGTLIQGTLTVNSDAANSPDLIKLSGEVLSVNVATMGLVSSVNPSMLNSAVTFTATITSPDTTLGGSVTFYDGTNVICNAVAVSNKAATCKTSALTLGSHNITADYTGDSDNSAATSPTVVQVVKQAATVALTVSPNPAVVLQSVTMMAKVTAANATPTGSVTFLDGTATVGSATLDGTGSASISTTTLAPGTHSITAKYSGDTTTAAGQSTPPVSEVINQATTATTIATTATPVTVGTSITLSSTVSSLNGTTPSGSVAFMEGAVTLGSGTIANGSASLTISTLAPGAHTIFARYSGDTDDATSDSSSLIETIQKIVTTTAVVATANPASAGDSVQVTATVAMVAGATADGAITGTVTFTDGGKTVGSQALSANGTASITLTAITAGPHSLVASYGGNTNYAISTSDSFSEVVNSTATMTALGVSGSGLSGKSVTLTASVSSSTGIPTGLVTFQDGGVNIGTGTLNLQGVAVFATTALGVGNHSLVAVYQGDANYDSSTSGPQAQGISLATTQLVLSGPASPVNAGTTLSFSTTLTTNGVVPTGGVTLKDSGTVIATQAANANGIEAFSGLTLAIGPHTLTATYDGDTHNASATSNSVSVTIQQSTTSTTLQTSVNPQVVGQSVTFTASVTSAGSGLTGSVNFLDGATVLGSSALANGTATFATSSLAFGPHTITAVYAGDTNHATSTSSSVVQHIVQPAQVSVGSSLNPSVSGANVTFTVKVIGNGTIVPTTTVNIMDGATVLSTATLDGSGAATYSTTALAVGPHSISAVYAGDSNYSTATSATLTQTVGNADTQIALVASVNPATYGSPVTLTAVVKSNGGLATGLITFEDSGAVIGTGTLDGTGTAALTTSSLAAGAHTIVANYAGDGKAGASVSPMVTVVVKQTSSVVVASNANPSPTLSPIVLTAHVTNAAQSVPSGSVTFTDGATQLGVGTLDASGNATLTVPQLSSGSHSIVGSYAGDNLDFASVSVAMLQAVQLRSTATTLSSTTDPTNPQQITLIAAIHYTGPSAPTGTVAFTTAGKTLGSASVDVNGVATLVIVLSNGQTEAVVATYSGDAAYTGSASPATSIGTGTPTDFTMTLNPASATIASKEHTVTSLTIASLNRFSDALEYGCLGLPYAATCTFSTTTGTLAAGGTTTVQLTIDTGNPLGAGAKAENKMPASNVMVCFVPGILLFGLGLVRSRKRSKLTMLALFLVFGATVASMTGCGGLTVNGTPAGTYQFQVTARATATGVTESQTMTLIVK